MSIYVSGRCCSQSALCCFPTTKTTSASALCCGCWLVVGAPWRCFLPSLPRGHSTRAWLSVCGTLKWGISLCLWSLTLFQLCHIPVFVFFISGCLRVSPQGCEVGLGTPGRDLVATEPFENTLNWVLWVDRVVSGLAAEHDSVKIPNDLPCIGELCPCSILGP